MHKKVRLSTLCFASLCFLSCLTRPANESNRLQTGETVFSTIPMGTILVSLPTSIFDNTTEGIDQQEMNILTQNQESDNWKVTESNTGRLTIACKNSNSTLCFYAYALDADAILIAQTFNEQAISTESWLYNSIEQTITRHEILPSVSINDFYSDADMVTNPISYNANVVMSVSDYGTLVYDVHSWMEEDLEMNSLVFSVTATWDGESFNLERSAL